MQSTFPLGARSHGIATGIRSTATGKAALAIGATAFVALCAHVSFPIYFSPVPVTLQTLAVILVGLMLGPALGFSALALYLLEGAIGLPVFSPQGPGGIAQLLGPTGGFLFAYPFAAAVAGYVARLASAGKLRFPTAIVAGCAASAVILGLGTAWFSLSLHASRTVALHMACIPFLPGECAKIAIAAAAYTSLYRWRQS